MPPVTNAIVLPTIYGNVIVNRHDINQTLYLVRTGAAIDYPEIALITQMVEPGTAVIDVGACFGLWTLAFAQRARVVYTFEAQRIVCNCICGSLALNSVENVFVYNVAVGRENGQIDVPKHDYHQELQVGCVYLGPRTEHGDMPEPLGAETVPLVTLDKFQIPEVGLIKIDVEGMELDVLIGAKETIVRTRPILYVETILTDRKKVEEFLEPLDYVFTGNEANLLAMPKEKYSLAPSGDGKTIITRLGVPA